MSPVRARVGVPAREVRRGWQVVCDSGGDERRCAYKTRARMCDASWYALCLLAARRAQRPWRVGFVAGCSRRARCRVREAGVRACTSPRGASYGRSFSAHECPVACGVGVFVGAMRMCTKWAVTLTRAISPVRARVDVSARAVRRACMCVCLVDALTIRAQSPCIAVSMSLGNGGRGWEETGRPSWVIIAPGAFRVSRRFRCPMIVRLVWWYAFVRARAGDGAVYTAGVCAFACCARCGSAIPLPTLPFGSMWSLVSDDAHLCGLPRIAALRKRGRGREGMGGWRMCAGSREHDACARTCRFIACDA